MNIRLILILTICMCCNIVSAQKEIKTKSGQKFLLYSDNTFVKLNKDGSQIMNDDADDSLQNNNLIRTEQNVLKDMLFDLETKEIKDRISLERQYVDIAMLQDKLSKAQKNDDETAIFELDGKLSEVEKSIKAIENRQAEFSEIIKKLRKINKKGSKNFLQDINDIKIKANEFGFDYEVLTPEKIVVEYDDQNTRSKPVNKDTRGRYEYQCDIVFDGEDVEKGEYRKSTSMQPIFSFTNKEMKSYYKEKNFINATSSVSKIGKYYYIFLDVKLKTNKAFKSYGLIPKNEDLIIKLIDGSIIKATTLTYINAEVLPNNEESIYRAFYKIGVKSLKKIASTEVDQIGIIWSTGYEEYNVYNVDLLKNQARCILN